MNVVRAVASVREVAAVDSPAAPAIDIPAAAGRPSIQISCPYKVVLIVFGIV